MRRDHIQQNYCKNGKEIIVKGKDGFLQEGGKLWTWDLQMSQMSGRKTFFFCKEEWIRPKRIWCRKVGWMVRWVGSNSRLENVLPWNQPISGGIDTEGMSKFRDLGEGRNLNKVSSS